MLSAKPQHQSWTIAHLQASEPDAAPFLEEEWDNSTLASTPSLACCDGRRLTTILRDAGEPSGIIISVDNNKDQQQQQVSLSRRALKRLWKLLQLIVRNFYRKQKEELMSITASSAAPSLGVNGVMV